ncbi:MAG TPA: nuclear transport factor 2 family protein [bacterium]|nr:nuclear transport factor 2 family protein [bacterium]
MVKKFLALLLTFGLTSMVFAQSAPTASPAVAAPAPVKKKKMMGGGDEQGIKKAFNAVATAWNDGDAKKVASFFTNDATLINPMGQQGQGRDGVLQVITNDLTGPLKGTQQTFTDFSITFVMPNLALVDCTANLTGMTAPDGTAAPATVFHFFGIVVNRGNGWQARTARIFAFLPAPGAASSSPTPGSASAAPGAAGTPTSGGK